MSRLMTMVQIREKWPRSRPWFGKEMAAGRFPKPLPGTNPGLWEADAVDRALASYIEMAKRQATQKEAEAKAIARRMVQARQRRTGAAPQAA